MPCSGIQGLIRRSLEEMEGFSKGKIESDIFWAHPARSYLERIFKRSSIEMLLERFFLDSISWGFIVGGEGVIGRVRDDSGFQFLRQ